MYNDNNITALKIFVVVLAVLGAVFLANKAWSQDGGWEHPPFGDFHKPWKLDTANRETVRKYFMFVNGIYISPLIGEEIEQAQSVCRTYLGAYSLAFGIVDGTVHCATKISQAPELAPTICSNLGSEFDRLEGDVVWCKPGKEGVKPPPMPQLKEEIKIPRGGRSVLL